MSPIRATSNLQCSDEAVACPHYPWPVTKKELGIKAQLLKYSADNIYSFALTLRAYVQILSLSIVALEVLKYFVTSLHRLR